MAELPDKPEDLTEGDAEGPATEGDDSALQATTPTVQPRIASSADPRAPVPKPGPGDPAAVVGLGASLDTSERHHAEKELRESEERFRLFAENSADVFWILNAETQQLEYINPVYDKIWGEPREVVMSDNTHWLELVHPEDREKASTVMQRILGGENVITEYRIVRPNDREVRWIRDTAFPIRDDHGRVTRVAGVAQDITRDRQHVAALRRTEERFHLLIEGARDYAMFLLDIDIRITFWSKGAERLFGWTEDEAIGQSGDLIFTPEDKTKRAVEKEIDIALRDGRAPDRRWHMRKDGSRFWTDGVLMRLNDEDGELRGFAKIARDATDERRGEEELRHARDQLEQRVLERTAEFMASNRELQKEIETRQQLERDLLEITERERRRIGQDLHDVICQELTATALFLKSSGNKAKDESTAKALNEAAQIVNRNVTIARDLARGFQPIVLGGGGLTAALRALCHQANENRDIVCHLELPRAIRVRDETIALNLYRIAQEAVRNALMHSGGTEIVICIERERELVRLVIEDNGKGFRPRKRSKGLGLHIMKYRTNVLGGTLAINRGSKGGTRVTCEVPIKR